MDFLTEIAGVVLAGLSFVLAGLGFAATRRYGDRRLGFVAAGLATIGLVGVLAVLHEVSPRYGGAFGVTPVLLFLLVAAVVLVYGALVARTPRPTAP